MWAGFSYYEPNRNPKRSDPYDLTAISSAAPYVDIVTTDQEMKTMFVRLGLHTRYHVEVYSSSLKDINNLADRLTPLR